MNGRIVLITLIGLLCGNNALLLGFKGKSTTQTTTTINVPKTTLIPPGRCFVSLTVDPQTAILGSLITFYSTLNCSVIPPIEYQCCYYFWQDNLSDNVTVTEGLTASYLSKIYETNTVRKDKYIMKVTVCWQKLFRETPQSDVQNSVCDYAVAMNITTFELTDTLNGILKLQQTRDYPGSSSALMIGKEVNAIFQPTDQRLEILKYKWIINGTEYMESTNNSIQFVPVNVGILSVELHVSDNLSYLNGTFKRVLECKEAILGAFIRGEKRLLVKDNGTFSLTYMGSGPFTFCWVVVRSGSSYGPDCIYELYSMNDDIMGNASFYVLTGSKSGWQKIIGNLTNDVSQKVLTFEFNVFATVNIGSGIFVIILIVAVLMSSLLTFIFCRKQPDPRHIEVADFDFYPGVIPTKITSLRGRIRQFYEFRILPPLSRLQQMFRAVPQEKQEMYTPLYESCLEERSQSSNTSASEEFSENLPMESMEPTLESFPRSNYGSI